MSEFTLLHGDCAVRIAEMDEGSIDIACCDPPYGLEFMGKEWDSLEMNRSRWKGQERKGLIVTSAYGTLPNFAAQARNPKCMKCGSYRWDHEHRKCKCETPDFIRRSMGPDQQRWHLLWVEQVFRVLQPGGLLLAFGGSRVYHRLAAAMAQVGFEDLQFKSWGYGSGFPKSHNLAKALDKHMGVEPTVIGTEKRYQEHSGLVLAGRDPGGRKLIDRKITTATSDEAKAWSGWGTALKPAWEPVVVGRKPDV